MSRRVVTTQLQATGTGSTSVDGFFDKLIKYIPSDIVAAWIFASSAIKSASSGSSTTLMWVVFAVLLVITPLWTWRWTRAPSKPPATTQIIIATISFAVWVFALGPPFSSLGFYKPVLGSIVLVIYTLVAAMINPADPAPVAPPATSQGSAGAA